MNEQRATEPVRAGDEGSGRRRFLSRLTMLFGSLSAALVAILADAGLR